MKPKTLVWIAVAAIVAVVAGWNLFKPAGGGISNVDAAGVDEAIAQGAQVIDVRTPGEYQLGHITGAVNAPVDRLGAQAAGWDRDTTYVVYCATGQRSQTAVEIMRALGFRSIRHFNAGIQAYPGPLEKGVSSGDGRVATNGTPVMIEFFTDA